MNNNETMISGTLVNKWLGTNAIKLSNDPSLNMKRINKVLKKMNVKELLELQQKALAYQKENSVEPLV